MKQEIKTAKLTTPPVPNVSEVEKTQYWLIIGEGENKVTINIGAKTYDKVNDLNGEKKTVDTIVNAN